MTPETGPGFQVGASRQGRVMGPLARSEVSVHGHGWCAALTLNPTPKLTLITTLTLTLALTQPEQCGALLHTSLEPGRMFGGLLTVEQVRNRAQFPHPSEAVAVAVVGEHVGFSDPGPDEKRKVAHCRDHGVGRR